MIYSNPENKYLVELLRAAIKSTLVPAPVDKIDWDRLIVLSKKQQVYSVIEQVVDVNLLSSEQAASLKNSVQSELIRILAMKNELEILKDELKQKEIKFMLLKGSVLRNYYPMQKMRQMSDIDILYDSSKRDELLKIMKKHGYRLTTACENSDDFFKEPFYTFEWHRELFFEEAEFCPHFDLWKNAAADSENPFEYHINTEDHFSYTICHMYKHYSTNGCGIRFLCDIYAFMQSEKSLDINMALNQLEGFGIKDFAVDAIALSKAIFEDTPVSENQQKMFDFMISDGVYGNHIVDYSKMLKNAGGSKLKYFFKRLFPSKKKMHADYKKLDKKPYLLAFFYMKRLFEKSKYNSKSALKEIRAVSKIDKKK